MNLTKGGLADRQAQFQSQIEVHKRMIHQVVSTYAWHAEDQQDLAQEVLLQLWRAYPSYDPDRVFSTWMYRVALNTAISWSRKSTLRTVPLTGEAEHTPTPHPESELTDTQTLYDLISTLDELSRALLLLYLEERSHAEIGEILGISAGNVAVKLNRLKSRLRLEADRQKE